MYFPLFQDKASERQACGRLYLNVKSCCPVVKLDLPPLDRQLPLFQKKLASWIAVAGTVDGVGFLVDETSCLPVTEELRRIDWTAGIRLAFSAKNRERIWPQVLDVHARHHAGGIVLLTPGDTTNSDLLRWIQDKQRELPLATIVAFGDVSKRDFDSELDYAKSVLDRLVPFGIESTCFLAGSYPVDNAELPEGTVTPVPRVEWAIYQQLIAENGCSFGDYGPQHSLPSDSKASSRKVTPAIRYATDEAWMVHRGNKMEWDCWPSQMRSLAQQVVEAGYYAGDFFSWGDSQLNKCASGTAPPPGNWQPIRTIEINHHVSHCAAATARLAGELTPPATPVAAGGP